MSVTITVLISILTLHSNAYMKYRESDAPENMPWSPYALKRKLIATKEKTTTTKSNNNNKTLSGRCFNPPLVAFARILIINESLILQNLRSFAEFQLGMFYRTSLQSTCPDFVQKKIVPMFIYLFFPLHGITSTFWNISRFQPNKVI